MRTITHSETEVQTEQRSVMDRFARFQERPLKSKIKYTLLLFIITLALAMLLHNLFGVSPNGVVVFIVAFIVWGMIGFPLLAFRLTNRRG